jgi:hypothetical protein
MLQFQLDDTVLDVDKIAHSVLMAGRADTMIAMR